VEDPAKRSQLGDRIEFIPPRCDRPLTFIRYKAIHAHRRNKVEAVWPGKATSGILD
jgi:hypothetical protein